MHNLSNLVFLENQTGHFVETSDGKKKFKFYKQSKKALGLRNVHNKKSKKGKKTRK